MSQLVMNHQPVDLEVKAITSLEGNSRFAIDHNASLL
jgi:hypothetical protein